ncbi:lipoprotein [Hydrogenophaga sp.]|uniref:LPS translocon maturation chaperone LptM n=1 Tax=Hydrogenophaga sp. TaxID=1904254 RepID=UPI00273223D2|nr:lipoprotein [Hydrogenophaga sp.]MDP2015185.1 lipoprotein [Hydrogenophaga sp.]MDP3168330.1 lipoprotein [Hydrogenophaga sp.]MDP3813192.1 lipoprotein [Hydrogenophaga sp.]
MLRTTRILGGHPSRTRGVAIALSLLLLSACGQKGPLYLPTAAPAPVSANPTQATPATQGSPAQR